MRADEEPDAARRPIIDAHTHILPLPLARRIRAFFDAHLPGGMVMGVEPEEVAARLRTAGVEQAWTLPYAHKPGMSARLNADVAALATQLSDERLLVVPGCTVHPGDADAGGVVHRAAEDGARVLKLHCSVGDHDVDDPRLDAVYAAAAATGMPVVVHAGRAVTGRTAADDLAALGAVARRHPRTNLIIAHTAHPAEAAALALLAQHDNLYADLTPVVAEAVELDAPTLDRLAPRLLFGSDSPNTALAHDHLLQRLRDSGATASALEHILGGTAASLLPDRR